MEKLKELPRFVIEIALTAILFIILLVLWNFVIKDNIVVSGEGLSTIGIALSTSLGILTAIVASFVLITWQSSRQERSTSFWSWINTLHQLFDFYDNNLVLLWDVRREILEFTWAASEVVLTAPMPRERLRALRKKVLDKVNDVKETSREIKEPSKEEVSRQRAYTDITNYMVLFTTANFEHTLSHYLYQQVLNLRGLLYRLLVVLVASIFTVTLGVIMPSAGISDTLNAPIAAILVAWATYVVILLGREIRRISLSEDEFRSQEKE